MIAIRKKDVLETGFIGKAYNFDKQDINTFFVVNNEEMIYFVPYFCRKISTSKEKECAHLESLGFKHTSQWKSYIPTKPKRRIRRK